MLRGGIGNAVLAPISEVLARLVVQITDTVIAAKDVLIEKESFRELGGYLEKIQPVLKELQDKNVRDTPPMRVSLEGLEREMKNAQELIQLCGSKGRIYLLINCRSLVKQVQDITHEVGRCLSLIPMASMNISVDSREVTAKLLQEMQNAQFRAAAADEAIVEKIELGIKDHRTDSSFANDLLTQIARAVGVSREALSLSQELEEFKKEREEAELKKNRAEAYQLEQIIALLSSADESRNGVAAHGGAADFQKSSTSSWRYSSFNCPLSHQPMTDPVEIASGETFERSAIERWFEEGHDFCPVTSRKLETLEMKPNFALRSAIEEAREKSVRVNIAANGEKLKSKDENEIHSGLWELYKLSTERALNRHWIGEAELIPVMVSLLQSKQRVTRVKALAALGSLALEDDNKERIMDAGALPCAVKSLSREVNERKEAVALLLELSKLPSICDHIGRVQGCILLLATLRNENSSVAHDDATALLDSLSNNSQNVVQMAEASYFKPLAVRLREGSDMDKILMASAISRMVLTDQGKATLSEEGAITPLVRMISMGNLEAKSAALGALQNLSLLPENRHEMIAAGVVQPLLRLLCSVTSSLVTLKEQAAATFANLATPPAPNEGNEILESEDTLAHLLSLLNLAGPEIQGHLLRALYGITRPEGALGARDILRAADAIQLLLPFCENPDDGVRVYALKLLFCLSGDGAGRQISEFLGHTSTRSLLDVMLGASFSDEEKAAAAGIIGNLPSNDNQLIDRLVQAGALTASVRMLRAALEKRMSVSKSVQDMLLENAAAALLHFTRSPREDLQRMAAEEGAILYLVELLSVGSTLSKSRAASALGQFSENSRRLTAPIPRSGGILSCCFLSERREPRCVLHRGRCSVKTSFCLVEAKAIGPLVNCMEEAGAQEAAADALSTLLHDDTWSQGVRVIAEAEGIRALVRMMTLGTPEAKAKALWMLEKVFRVDKYREEFGSSAKMPLIELTSRGSIATRPVAARILAHLDFIHNQSSYF